MQYVVAITLLARVVYALATGKDSPLVDKLVAVERPQEDLVLPKPLRVFPLSFQCVLKTRNEVVANLKQLRFYSEICRLPLTRQALLISRIAEHVFVLRRNIRRVVVGCILPNNRATAVCHTKQLIEYQPQGRQLNVVDARKENAILAEKALKESQPRIYHAKPFLVAR